MEAILDRVVSALDHGDDGVFDVAVEAAVAMLTHPFMYKYVLLSCSRNVCVLCFSALTIVWVKLVRLMAEFRFFETTK